MAFLKSIFFNVALCFLALFPGVASADDTLWNMPYARPAKYDYSKYFSADVNNYLKINPTYFKTRLTSGWNYYKTHFLMSNGLVMQMTGAGVNTTTAVSEGIGYGMLLALLNNDQPVFNKIFNAANQFMWDGGHNSYYNWKIVNGSVAGSGAATDADLDICLALIFADKLTQFSSITKWQAFGGGGVTYKSRATQMLTALKNSMSSGNYILPGDNWGGDGINNLNPSYFATGYLRVFDQFQTAISFAPLAGGCYSVLKACRNHYPKGQAPDWCNTSGGQASQPPSGQEYQGMGMTNDGIRTPWRICMDALWFNTTDAIAFCANSRNTITQYANVTPTSLTVVVKQMAQYTNSQAVIMTTAGQFHIISMWLCSAIGSKDTTYSKKCLNGSVIGKVAGQSDCFGDKSMSDQYYYYNQSLGMLGFAAFTGMFPNVLADTIKAYVKTDDVRQNPATKDALCVRAAPGGVRFTLGESATAKSPVSAALYDVKGQRVLSRSIRPGSPLFLPVDKGSLGNGVYTVKATVREGAEKKFEYRGMVNWKFR